MAPCAGPVTPDDSRPTLRPGRRSSRASSAGRLRNGECPPGQLDRIDPEPLARREANPLRIDRAVLAAHDGGPLDVRPRRQWRGLGHHSIRLGAQPLRRPARGGGRNVVVEELGGRVRADHPDVVAEVRPLRGHRRDATVDGLRGPLVVRAEAGRGQERPEEDEPPDGSTGRHERDDETGHRVTDQHRLRAWGERLRHDRGVVGGAEARVRDRQVHRDHAMAQALQLGPQEVPAPGSVIGTMDERDVHPTPFPVRAARELRV